MNRDYVLKMQAQAADFALQARYQRDIKELRKACVYQELASWQYA